MKKQLSKTWVIILSLFVMLLWGSLFPVIKLGYKEFDINTAFIPNLLFFAGIRFTICGAIIVAVKSVKQKGLPKFKTGKEWLGVLLVGLTAVILHYACTYIGLSKVESSKTALIKQSGVLIFICFSFLFVKDDKFSIYKLFGAIFGLASIVVLDFNSLSFEFNLGELLIILASVGTVASNVVCKLFLKDADSTLITGFSELFGGAALLIVGAILGGGLYSLTLKGGLLFVYIIVATVISYMLWYFLVNSYDLSSLFIIKLSESLFTAVISAIILSEDIFKWQYLVSFIFVGLALVISNLNIVKRTKNEVR